MIFKNLTHTLYGMVTYFIKLINAEKREHCIIFNLNIKVRPYVFLGKSRNSMSHG